MKHVLMLAVLAGLIALGVWGFMEGQQEKELEVLREKPVEVPLRVVEENGQQIVRFSKADNAAAAIRIQEVPSNAVPAAALVWSGDKAWVYAESAPRMFRKVPVSIKEFKRDYYELEGLPAPATIVTQGAQLLLSEEKRGWAKVGEENE